MIVKGMIATKALIEGNKREVLEVILRKGKSDKDSHYLIKLLNERAIPYSYMDKEAFYDEYGKDSGATVAICKQRNSDSLEALFKNDVIFYLDGIEDPYNLGFCLRTLCAFGFSSVLTSHRDYTDSEAIILRSSAGAYDKINLLNSENPYLDLKEIKDKGYKLLALERSDESLDLFKAPLSGKICLLLGGEKRGINKEILKLCEHKIVIPYGSSFRNALSAVSACDVVATIAFERRRDD